MSFAKKNDKKFTYSDYVTWPDDERWEGGAYSKGEIFGPKEILNLVSLEGIKLPLWEVFEAEGPGQGSVARGQKSEAQALMPLNPES
jgi:hypothetical protein